MDDAVHVGLGDRVARHQHVEDRLLGREGAEVADALAEVGALEVLEREVDLAAVERADVEHARDVIAVELGDGARLAKEATLRLLLVLEQVGPHELEGDVPVERQVRRLDDDAHPAAPEDAVDEVAPRDDFSGLNR